MDCENARTTISALLDGEPPDSDPSEFAAHMAECAECRLWKERAHTITRRVRLAPADPAPVASPGLLAALGDALPRRVQSRRQFNAARVALVLTALAQIALAAPALIFGTDREAPMHVAHEMGSFDMALAVGFLVVAWQPLRARGMHLLVAAAATLLIVTAVIDLAAGRTTLTDEAPHLLVVVGWLLMFRLADWTPLGDGRWRGHEPLREHSAAAGTRRAAAA